VVKEQVCIFSSFLSVPICLNNVAFHLYLSEFPINTHDLVVIFRLVMNRFCSSVDLHFAGASVTTGFLRCARFPGRLPTMHSPGRLPTVQLGLLSPDDWFLTMGRCPGRLPTVQLGLLCPVFSVAVIACAGLALVGHRTLLRVGKLLCDQAGVLLHTVFWYQGGMMRRPC